MYVIKNNNINIDSNSSQLFTTDMGQCSHLNTNYTKWESLPLGGKMEASYEPDPYVFGYEPLYVSRAGAPEFDERYIGFGKDRNTQVCFALLIQSQILIYQVIDLQQLKGLCLS